MKMNHKARMYKRNLKTVSEAYTTKTCGHCGSIHKTIGSNKVYNCNNCSTRIDRDINGARNILIRTCTKLGNDICPLSPVCNETGSLKGDR